VVSAALRVLDVLAQGHERGVLHRDVKPSNIFRTDSGAIKLLDYGIARVEGDLGRFMTRPGTTLGTPGFMAPELAAGRLDELDALTDLWALGATMFQLLTGDDVHRSQNDNELLVLAATQPARSLGTLRPELDKALVKVVDRALAFERRERWPSARAMHTALAEAARVAGLFGKQPPTARPLHEAETAPEMSVPNSQPAPGSARGRARLAWVLFALFALALGGTALALRTSGRHDWQVDSGAASVLPPRPTQIASPAAQTTKEASASLATSVVPKVSSSPMPPALNSASLERPSAGTKKNIPHAAAPHAAAPNSAPESSNPLFFPGK
jgi:serine/threonine-protein kinase